MPSLTPGADFPPAPHNRVWNHIGYLAALRSGDEGAVRSAAKDRRMGADPRKPYIVSPIPGMLTRVVADMLYGEEPRITATNDADQDALSEIVQANSLPAELVRAATISISEGEVWGRVIADPTLAPYPVIEFLSRQSVLPVFRGRFLIEATIVSEWSGDKEGQTYRLLETHRAGEIESHLYLGNHHSLGREVPLESRRETAETQMLVRTGIPYPLIVRIVNRTDADQTLGQSDLEPLIPLFLAIYEAMTITAHNARLTGAKRLMVERDALDENGNMNLGDDVFVYEASGVDVAGSTKQPFSQIQYSFEATELIGWLNWLIDHTLTAGGVSPATVGRGETGGSLSGTALKLRMAHTLSEVAGKGRQLDAGVSQLLRLAQLLDAKPTAEGGFGRQWAEPDSLPIITRGDGLPRDEKEEAQITASLAAADAVSIEERVRRTHPNWDDTRVEEEVVKIESANPAMDLFPTGA